MSYKLSLSVLFVILIFSNNSISQITSSSDGDYSANSSWVGSAPNANSDNVLIINNLNLDVDIIIKQNFEIQGSLNGTSNKDITVKNSGVLTIGDLDINGELNIEGNGTLIINSGDTVYIENLNITGSASVLIKTNAVVYINNDFLIKNTALFTLENSAEIHVGNDFNVQNSTSPLIDGNIFVTNVFNTKNTATIVGNGSITAGIETEIKNTSSVFGSTTPCTNCIYTNGCSFSIMITKWTGAINNDWFNILNWTDGIPAIDIQVVISPTPIQPIINGLGAKCFHITIESGASLEIFGMDTLAIYGDMKANGALISNSSILNFAESCWPSKLYANDTILLHSLVVNNSNDVTVSTGYYELIGTMTINNGSFYTNDSLTIISNASGTGRIAEIKGVGISGKISMERYIDAGETYWRYMGSAVQGATIEQFNDDFTTAGYPGSLFPNFPWISIYNYDESLGTGLGYQACTGSSQSIAVGEGWQVWSGDTITGTEPFIFDLKGVPNQGDIDLPVTYTPIGVSSEDGFNLVCNPYPSTIDWDDTDWLKTNIGGAIYIQNPDNQQYATYSAGASTNGGSKYIASQQAFWVQATGVSPVLTAKEGVKASIDQPFIKSSSQMFSKGIKLKLENSTSTEFDEVILRHIEGTSDNFDAEYDATKWWGGWGEYPQLSILNSQMRDLTIHSFDKKYTEWQIPLRAVVFEDGIYSITFQDVHEMNVPCIKLEDTYTDSIYSIEEGSTFAFEMFDTTYLPRFIIHIGKNYNITTNDISCHGYSDGNLELNIAINESFDYHIIAKDFEHSNSAYETIMIDNLQKGNYVVEISGLMNQCNETTFNFTINEPIPLTITENISHEILGQDGSIEVKINGGIKPYEYKWSNDETSDYLNHLAGGIYTLQIHDYNNCSINDTYEIMSKIEFEKLPSTNAQIYYNDENGMIEIKNTDLSGQHEVILFSSSGGKIFNSYINFYSGNSQFYIPTSISSGMYILNIKDTKYRWKIVKK